MLKIEVIKFAIAAEIFDIFFGKYVSTKVDTLSYVKLGNFNYLRKFGSIKFKRPSVKSRATANQHHNGSFALCNKFGQPLTFELANGRYENIVLVNGYIFFLERHVKNAVFVIVISFSR